MLETIGTVVRAECHLPGCIIDCSMFFLLVTRTLTLSGVKGSRSGGGMGPAQVEVPAEAGHWTTRSRHYVACRRMRCLAGSIVRQFALTAESAQAVWSPRHGACGNKATNGANAGYGPEQKTQHFLELRPTPDGWSFGVRNCPQTACFLPFKASSQPASLELHMFSNGERNST